MHIVVAIKSVIVKAPENRIERSLENCALNPFDRPALALALALRAEHGGSVTAVSMGPKTAEDALYEALALGVDRGVQLCDPALAGSDTLATSTALAAAIKKLSPFDLCLFGVRTADSDTGQVGPQTAVLLERPLVTGAISVKDQSGKYLVERLSDGFKEVFEVDPPAVLTIHPTALVWPDVPLSGIERAYAARRIDSWPLALLGLSASEVGEKGSGTRVLSLQRVKRDRKCDFIAGAVEEQAEELVRRLVDAGLIE